MTARQSPPLMSFPRRRESIDPSDGEGPPPSPACPDPVNTIPPCKSGLRFLKYKDDQRRSTERGKRAGGERLSPRQDHPLRLPGPEAPPPTAASLYIWGQHTQLATEISKASPEFPPNSNCRPDPVYSLCPSVSPALPCWALYEILLDVFHTFGRKDD